VIDASQKDRLTEAQDELIKLVAEKELKDACLLILINKQVKKFKIENLLHLSLNFFYRIFKIL